MKRGTATALVIMPFAVFSFCCGPTKKADRDKALKDLEEQVNGMLPTVASLTGIQEREAIAVDMLTRAELGKLFESVLELEFPNQELKRRSECFAEIGLLPHGYDLTTGLLELLKEQAGGVYNQHNKTLVGVFDLPPERKRVINNKMIVSHELTHALQDRVIDIARQSEMGLKNIDYEYSVRALIEGMASGVMVAYARNVKFDGLPDLQSFWRSQLSQATGAALGRSPQYVREYLMSPYAEGGAFIQSWLRANRAKQLNDLLEHIPLSSEQVLHFEKYAEGDVPTTVKLPSVSRFMQKGWILYYANTLGEFDLLSLFQLHAVTRLNAAELAAGWDGCQFEAYKDNSGRLILFGTSVWDTEKDANEFCNGVGKVLKDFRSKDDFAVKQNKTYVSFVIGTSDKKLQETIMKSLLKPARHGQS